MKTRTQYLSALLPCFLLASCSQLQHHNSANDSAASPPIPIIAVNGEEFIYGGKFKNEDEYRVKFMEYQSALAQFIMTSFDTVYVCLNGQINEKGYFEAIGSHTQPFPVTTLTKDDLREINRGQYFYTSRMKGIMYTPLSAVLYTKNAKGDYITSHFNLSVDEEEKDFIFLEYQPSPHQPISYSVIIKSPHLWKKLVKSITKYKKKPYTL